VRVVNLACLEGVGVCEDTVRESVCAGNREDEQSKFENVANLQGHIVGDGDLGQCRLHQAVHWQATDSRLVSLVGGQKEYRLSVRSLQNSLTLYNPSLVT